MRSNRFRERLDAGQPTLGTHLLSTWPTLTELVRQTGLNDYAKYTPFDLHELDHLGRALEVAASIHASRSATPRRPRAIRRWA
jgi:hypothetical protein